MNSEIDEFGHEDWGGELPWADEDPSTETMYARRRRPERTYLSRTFNRPEKARFVYKVFDGPQTSAKYDGREWTVIDGENGRAQIKLLLIEESWRNPRPLINHASRWSSWRYGEGPGSAERR